MRIVASAEDFAALVRADGSVGPLLIVAPLDALSYEVLNAISEASVAAQVIVGVLACDDHGPLPRTHDGPVAPSVAASYSNFELRVHCDSEFGREEAEGFMHRVAAGVEAVVLHGHGNGVDLQVGDSVLCVQVDHLRGDASGQERTLPCQIGGPCRMDHLPLRAYWGASAFRARIAVLLSCWGFLPADALVANELGFAAALLRGGSVEALVASTRVTYGTPEVTRACRAFLERGGTVGHLTLLLNSSAETASPAYVCIGDPDTTIASNARQGLPPHQCAGALPDGLPPRELRLPQLLWLEDLVRELEGPPAELVALREATASLVRGHGQPLARGLARWLAEQILRVGLPPWSAGAVAVGGESGGRPCPLCGSPFLTQEWSYAGLPTLRRRLERCPIDGLVRDTQAGPGMLSVEPGPEGPRLLAVTGTDLEVVVAGGGTGGADMAGFQAPLSAVAVDPAYGRVEFVKVLPVGSS